MPNKRGGLLYFAWYLGISARERIFGGQRIDLFEEEKFTELRHFYQAPVLDVGCGRGDYAMMLKRAGIEVSCPDVVEECAYPELPF